MSLAKFTGGSWNDMDSRRNAPRIYAAVVRRPDDFRNVPPYTVYDDLDLAVIPQVCWDCFEFAAFTCVGVGVFLAAIWGWVAAVRSDQLHVAGADAAGAGIGVSQGNGWCRRLGCSHSQPTTTPEVTVCDPCCCRPTVMPECLLLAAWTC